MRSPTNLRSFVVLVCLPSGRYVQCRVDARDTDHAEARAAAETGGRVVMVREPWADLVLSHPQVADAFARIVEGMAR